MKIWNQALALIAFTFLFFGPTPAIGQDQKIMSSYDRPTVAHIILRFDDQSNYEDKVIAAFQGLPLNPKYNQADIDITGLEAPISRKDIYDAVTFQSSKKAADRLRRFVSNDAEFFEPTDSFGLVLADVLSDKFNVGGLMLGEWATKDSRSGTFPVIEKRSQYNLKASDIQAKKDYTKLDVFKGVLLKNYIIVYDVQDQDAAKQLQRTASDRVDMNVDGVGKDKVLTVIHAYIFKVEVSEELFNSFVAPNFSDASKIGSHNYPLRYMGHAMIKQDFDPAFQYDLMRQVGNVEKKGLLSTLMGEGERDANSVVKPESMSTDEPGYKNNITWQGLSQENRDQFTFSHIAETCFDDLLNIAEKFLEDFKVKTAVTGTDPLTAAVGLREGIRADQRFRVYENVYEKGEVVTKSVGIVRATNKIADNTASLSDQDTDEFLQTTFKQVYGGKIKEDMLMAQDNDFGISFSLGTTFGYFKIEELPSTIFHFRGSYNISRNLNKILGKNSLYGYRAYFGLGLGSKKQESADGRFNTFAIDFGMEKHLYLHPKFDIVPETGLTINSFGVSNNERADFSEEGYLFWNLGVRIPVMLKEGFAIEPAFHIPLHISSNEENPASILHISLRGRLDF